MAADFPDPFSRTLRVEWGKFLTSRGCVAGMAVAALVIVLLAVLAANGIQVDRPDGAAPPSVPLGPDGLAVTDRFYFMHRPLAGDGGITARVAPLTGIITYPPPTHDQIVSGVVPWAKAGVIIKESTKPGSAYAAMMLTGSRGVRMQYNFSEDLGGRIDAAAARDPVWLRLTRTGDMLTGYESTDGTRWTEVGTARLAGLPETVEVGLFAASPGDVTLSQGASRFTQASAVFDHVSLEGNTAGDWRREEVGSDGAQTDWERFHRAAGVVESAAAYTVTGSGDIAPGFDGPSLGLTLIGTLPALIAVLFVGANFATLEHRRSPGVAAPLTRRRLAAKAVVIGSSTIVVGLTAAFAAISLGKRILDGHQVPYAPLTAFTELRVAAGTGALLAVSAVLTLALGVLMGRRLSAILVALALIVLPYVLAMAVLAGADGWELRLAASQWLLRLTPAAAFAVQQATPAYPQVLGPYTPVMGYFPLSPLAGFAVLCGYTTLMLGLAAMLRTQRNP